MQHMALRLEDDTVLQPPLTLEAAPHVSCACAHTDVHTSLRMVAPTWSITDTVTWRYPAVPLPRQEHEKRSRVVDFEKAVLQCTQARF